MTAFNLLHSCVLSSMVISVAYMYPVNGFDNVRWTTKPIFFNNVSIQFNLYSDRTLLFCVYFELPGLSSFEDYLE